MRRADDRRTDLAAMAFARMLKTRPPLDDVVRLVVALLCWPIGARGALIVTASGDRVDVLAEHAEQDIDPVEGPDSWKGPDRALPEAVHAIIRGATSGRPVLDTDPSDAADPILAAWPLGATGEGTAVLVLFLTSPMSPSLVAERVGDLAEVLAVYLAGAAATDMPHPAADVEMSPRTVGLTTRQLRIVELMAEECTNPQISSRIGFSTSTVRMESLRIYRALGVHDRGEAVITARGLGLLPSA